MFVHENFKTHTKVILKYKVGRYDPPSGTQGTVKNVDLYGYVHVVWDDPHFSCDRMYLPKELVIVS